MTRAARRLWVKKELSALAGPWLAAVVAMAAPIILGARQHALRELVLPLYVIGVAALGALSMGHEYNTRTLGILLSQPIGRQRLFLLKQAVLAAPLVALGGVLTALLWGDPRFSPLGMIVVLPLLGGQFVTPWLTMAARSAIAGALFSMAIPGTLFTAAQLLYLVVYKQSPTAAFNIRVLGLIALALCPVGAVMGWRTFMRLEALEGVAAGARSPEWLKTITARAATALPSNQHSLWLLVKKELRLQQLALVVAALYALWFLAVRWMQPFVLPRLAAALGQPFAADRVDDTIGVISVGCALLIVLVVGSLASAEERQLGTLEWQLTLPVAVWKQWAVKVGVTMALSLCIALVVPALLLSMSTRMARVPLDMLQLPAVIWILVLASGSLYASSFSTNGLRALMLAVAAAFVATVAVSLSSDLFLVSALMQRPYAVTALGCTLTAFFTWRALANHQMVRG